MSSCANCGGVLEYQEASGDTVCTACGTVAEESNIVAQVEFVENGGGATSVVGQYLSATASRPFGQGGPGYGPSKESREVRAFVTE
jgi:transcription factor IIIB 90 kDa subunit